MQEFLFTFVLYIWLFKPASCHNNSTSLPMNNLIHCTFHEIELLKLLLMSYTQYTSFHEVFEDIFNQGLFSTLTSYLCVCVKEKGGECSDTVYERPSVSWRHKDTFEHKHTQTYTVWLQPQINDQEWFDLSKSHSKEHDFRKKRLAC